MGQIMNFSIYDDFHILEQSALLLLIGIVFCLQYLVQGNSASQFSISPSDNYLNSLDESAYLAQIQARIALGLTVLGYWAMVFSVYYTGGSNINIHLMSCIALSIFFVLMLALPEAYRELSDQNVTNTMSSISGVAYAENEVGYRFVS
jgi:hypothetical protein